MNRPWTAALALGGTLTLLAACGTGIDYSDGVEEPAEGATAVAESGPAFDFEPLTAADRVCVILPDGEPDGRWERYDRPTFQSVLDAAGLDVEIRDAGGDPSAVVTVAQEMLSQGCSALVLSGIDDAAGVAVIAEADVNGVPVVDYDRLTTAGGASYFVGFDHGKTGKVLADGLASCAASAGHSSGPLQLFTGPVTSDEVGSAFTKTSKSSGYEPRVEPLADGAAPTLGASTAGAGGSDDRTTSALAESASKIPLAGAGTSIETVQGVLAGRLCVAAVNSAVEAASAAAELAIALTNSDYVAADELASAITVDPETGAETPTVLIQPRLVTVDDVKGLVDDGLFAVEDLCTPALIEACSTVGIG